jgi:MATE family multidrug resistance protein
VRPKSVVGEVWAQAWPTVLTMASYTVMQFVDALMVAELGPLEVAAQGNGGVWSFTLMSFLFGIVTMVNTFASQNVGAGRPHEAAAYGWAGLWFSLCAWILLLVPYAFVLPSIFAAMGHEPRLVELESAYAQILLLGGFVTLAGKSMSNFFFGIGRPRVIAVAAISGNIANIVLNYVLIYGEAGVPSLGLPGIPGTPALGVAGAAIATVLGTAVECCIPLVIFLGRKMHASHGTRTDWQLRTKPIAALCRVGWPNALSFGNEIVCWAIFMSVLVGLFGTLHLSAGWITLRFMHLSFMPAVGFSVAATSLVGRYIGAGEPDQAARRARVAVLMALGYMTVCGLLMFAFREELVSIFLRESTTSQADIAEILRIGSAMMICAAIFQTFDAIGIVYSGALRGAGDTTVPGIATVVLSWTAIVGGGWLLATQVPQWESIGPWVASAVYIILLGFFMGWRFESGRWRSIRLIERPAEGH